MNPRPTDVEANRRSRPYSRAELAGRVAWAVLGPAFRWSPRPLFAWRAALLRLLGARIGRAVHIYPSVRIALPWNLSVGDHSALGDRAIVYDLGPVSIGARVTISQGAHLCAGTHDHNRSDMPLRRTPIRIEDDAWVCAEAFVGPDVVIGRGAIVGARAVAVRSVPDWAIVAGNPARRVGTRRLEG